MSFRARLILLFGLAAAAITILLSLVTSEVTRRAFERVDEERTRTIVAQFRREYAARSREVVRRVESMAAAESVARLAAEMTRPGADPAPYIEHAATLAREQNLEIVELVGPDGSIVSSAHYPARFGSKKLWVTQGADQWKTHRAFVEIEEFPDSPAVALLAIRPVRAAEGGSVFIVGGERLDKGFLDALATPRGMTAALYTQPRPALQDSPEIAALVKRVRDTGHEAGATIATGFEPARTIHGIPLQGRSGQSIGVLLLTSVHAEMWSLTWFIRFVGLIAAIAGIILGLVFAWWVTARVTRPVQDLAAGAREVAAGNWHVTVPVDSSTGEIGDLGRAFNRMTQQLVEQRGRLVQVERVAAWRELARRLAHELKNPLFPLQLTVENLQRAREKHPEQFDEVFREGTSTLLAELAQLKTIIGRFSDFARMPSPRLERLNLSEFLPPIVKLFEPQWQAPGHPRIDGRLDLAEPHLALDADPEQLTRALRNLILNAMDALPEGGQIDVRARRNGSEIEIEVADSGAGLSKEECERLFTPYYTTKQHGTGLGLAIVQSVVSDHGGRITVDSEPGKGATFRIALPVAV
jgi:two-component system, NtrC family, nitrogen regulation sensor histidine kinase NtrY